MMIIPVTYSYAAAISGWKYGDEYSIYSFERNDETLKELMNGDYYICLDEQGSLLGYYCFGKSAQIPTEEKNIYNPEFLDIGLGMTPAGCGKGEGCRFVKTGLNFAQDRFQIKRFRLTVAAFNKRAIRVYEKVGFQTVQIVIHHKTKKEFLIMTNSLA